MSNIKYKPTKNIIKKGMINSYFIIYLFFMNIIIILLDVHEEIKDANDTELITNEHNRMEISKTILSFIFSNVDIQELRNLLNSEVS